MKDNEFYFYDYSSLSSRIFSLPSSSSSCILAIAKQYTALFCLYSEAELY